MKRKSKTSKLAIERIELSKDATRLLREFQYLKKSICIQNLQADWLLTTYLVILKILRSRTHRNTEIPSGSIIWNTISLSITHARQLVTNRSAWLVAWHNICRVGSGLINEQSHVLLQRWLRIWFHICGYDSSVWSCLMSYCGMVHTSYDMADLRPWMRICPQCYEDSCYIWEATRTPCTDTNMYILRI